ncbi:(deoxy)nucleoside triphosphate pyrophosphohydrolase [Chloroflexota bacterium]
MQPAKTNVIAAVIQRDSKYLLCQRALDKRYGGLWEFPGGKLEPGENFLDAARRELCEELSIQVDSIGDLLYSHQDPGSSFVINFWEIEIQGEPNPNEHNAIKWVAKGDLLNYDLAVNDRKFCQRLTNQKGGLNV